MQTPTSQQILAQLIAFDTTSHRSNLALMVTAGVLSVFCRAVSRVLSGLLACSVGG